MPNFPTELKFYEAVRKRVDLAREVDKLELAVTKKQKQNQWYENAAKELEVDLDDWMYPLHFFVSSLWLLGAQNGWMNSVHFEKNMFEN